MLEIKYLILIWIIVLVIFTFYCIYRLSGFTYPIYSQTTKSSLPINKFENINQPILRDSVSNTLTKPTSQNFIEYVNNIKKQDKITDIPECVNVYDDNIAVRSLGYNNCSSANADYFARNLDINQKYGNANSLAQLCPITTKSDTYMYCMKQLLNKFNTNANIVESINTDMTNLLNKRLNDRTEVLNNVEISLNPYLFSQNQVDFNNNMTLGEPINPTPDQVLENVNNYYQTKYGGSKSVFNNIPQTLQTPQTIKIKSPEHFASNLEIYNIDPYIETYFFGSYTPLKGQYLAFNNLTITLNYVLDTQASNQASNQLQNQSVKKVFLTIIDNNTNAQIVYRVNNIDFYLQYKNVIKIDLFDQTINSTQPTDTQTLQQLLNILGITVPNRLIMTIDEFTSSEKITRKTYKLLNVDMNTIMVLEKN